MALNFAAWATQQSGEPPVPVESLRVTLRRRSDTTSIALDTVFGFNPDTLRGDSVVVRLSVRLRQSPEDFLLRVLAFGRGTDWFRATSAVQLTANGTASANLLANYIGPGYDATRVAMVPADTTVVGGVAVRLHAKVYKANGDSIPGVPIGYRLSDSTRASVARDTLSLSTATLTGRVPLRDSVRVVAEIPTHLKDSTVVRIIPPPSQLAKISGDNQTGVIGGALPQRLVTRVLDALGGGFKGDTVRWTVAAGTATLSAATTGTDDTGYASVAVTPTAIGPVTVQAARPGLTGSPVTFAATATAGTVYTVTISPKVDTVQRGATRQFTVVLKDSLGNTVTAAVTWTSAATTVATINSSGLATALAGDSTNIIAASGGKADTARLYVRVLRAVTVSPADTVITAVGDSLLLRVALRDNFGATRTGLDTIRFVSASPTIAAVNRTSGRVTVTGPGNAVILAIDSTPGVPSPRAQGAATVRVNQTLTAVVNSPRDTVSLVVGVSGQSQILARGVDRNGFTIPNTTLGWASRNTGVATVSATGVVTGVALGTAYVADSVGSLKDSTKVVVSAAPPKLIQWAFDSTSVGNGGNVSIALSLTQPAASALTINITSSDTTIAKPSSPTATIGAGASATSVVINGFRAGRAILTASDGSGQGYASRTMIIAVVSTIDFREIAYPGYQQTYFYLNQNETHRAQVWLSDPAPAGGLGITFVYGRAGTSVVTPSPAIIPAGQLAADVTFQGLAPGPSGQPDSVVPTSGGYVGRFSYVYVAPDSLRLYIPYYYYYATPYLGVGQTFQPYVQFTYAMDHPLVVSTRLARVLGTTPDTVTIPTGSTSRYFDVVARTAGADTLIVSAPGWITARGAVVFTTPRLQITGTTSLVAGAPNGYWYAYTQDSLGIGHAVVDSVAVTVVSRNPAAVAIDTALTYVRVGNSNTSARYSLRPLPTAGGDSAWIVATATAPGITYRPDSMKVYVTRPTLNFAVNYPYDFRTGVGTIFQSAGYVNIPYARPDTFTVLFGHSRRGIVSGPDSVSIPKGQTYAYFDVRGDTLGQDTISVTRATGYVVSGSPQVFRVDPIHVRPYSYPGTLYTISRPQLVNAYVFDSVNGQARPLVAPLRIAISSSNAAAFTLDSAAVTIPAGAYFSNYDTLRLPVAAVVDSGRIRTTAPGSSPDSSALIRVIATPLNFSVAYPYSVSRGLKLQNNYVYLPDTPRDTVVVTLTDSTPLIASLSTTTVKIPPTSNYSTPFDITGLDSAGTAIIAATASGFVPARMIVATQPSVVNVSNLGASHLTTEPPQYVYTYLRTASGYGLNAASPVVFTIKSTDSTVIAIDSAGQRFRADSAVDTVPAGQSYAYFKIRYVGSGTARVLVSAPGFRGTSTELVTVTGPSLYFGATTVTVGVNQVYPSQYVYVNNAVTGSPLVVRLTRSDSLPGTPVANQVFGLSAAGDSVVIPVGSNSATFDVTGRNAGAALLIARAIGYSQATAAVSVGTPQLFVPSTLSLYVGAAPTNVTVYTEDQGGNIRAVASPTVVTTSSSDATVATADSTTVTIPTGQYFRNLAVRGLKKGTTAIVFASTNYRPDTIAVTVDTGQLALGSPPNGLGPGQVAQNAMYVYLPFTTSSAVTVTLTSSNTGVLTVPSSVIIPANNSYVYFDVTGVGQGTATVSATAAGFRAATPVGVTIGQPKLLVSLAATSNVGQPTVVTVYAQDANGTSRNLAVPLSVTLSSSPSANATFRFGTITIPAGSSFAQDTVTFSAAGSYTINASATGYTGGSQLTSAAGALVTVGPGVAFTPTSVTVPVGRTVTWTWAAGSLSHGVQWLTGSPLPANSPTQTAGSYSWTFTVAGTYTYQCAVHGTAMTGTVTVQ